MLRCSFCALAWEVPPRRACRESGASRSATAPLAEPHDTGTSRFAQPAPAMLKTVDTDELLPFPLVAIIDSGDDGAST